MKTTAVILMVLFTSLAYSQGHPEWFINAYGDTLYSRCCPVPDALQSAPTAQQNRAERKELRTDNRLKRRFDRKMNAWYRRDQRMMRKQHYGDQI